MADRTLECASDRGRETRFTPGNGSPFVIVVRSDGCGLRLVDLATGRDVLDRTTGLATFCLSLLWLIHLFCMTAVKSNPWFSLLIGALGMFQNTFASDARRHSSALGLHLSLVQTIHDVKVFKAMEKVEEVESGVGVLEVWKMEKIEKWREDKGLLGGRRSTRSRRAGYIFPNTSPTNEHL